jgi:hypothetical protein
MLKLLREREATGLRVQQRKSKGSAKILTPYATRVIFLFEFRRYRYIVEFDDISVFTFEYFTRMSHNDDIIWFFGTSPEANNDI